MRTGVRLLSFVLLAGVLRAEGEVRLLTDDAIPRYLARGKELARAEQWDKVVDVLHRVVVGDRDIFPDLRPEVLHSAVYSEDDRIYYPARELCLQELARLPPEGLEAYRAAYDAEAKALFATAESTDDVAERLARYGRVYDLYLPSTVGDDALEKAADLHLAQGRFYEALALYRRLVDLYPKDTDRDVAMVLAKAAFCAARIGDREHRDTLLERLASGYAAARLKVRGETVAAADLKDHPLMTARGGDVGDLPGEWTMPGGNPARSRVPEDLPEDLPPRPLWSFRLDERDARLTAAYGLWMVSQHDREPSPAPGPINDDRLAALLSPYPTVRPIVVDGTVLYKDGVELVARRLASGAYQQFRPRFRPLGSPDSAMSTDPRHRFPIAAVRPGVAGSATDAGRYEKIYRFYDFGGASVVAGSGHILSLEWNKEPSDLLTQSPLQAGLPNVIACYDGRTGKTKWGWARELPAQVVHTDPEARAAWERDFEMHAAPQFFGPGVISGGLAYTIAQEDDGLAGVSLWCFDLEDGRVRFRTPLHYADETQALLPRGATVSVAGGTAYVLTHAGILAAVDALPPGRVRWISRYERNYTRTRARRGRGTSRGMVEQGFAYQEPLVAGGKVFAAPADSDYLLAFDTETGKIAWKAPREKLDELQVHTILGLSQGVLVLSGDAVVGLDAMRLGEKVWGPHRLEGWARGRGFVGERYAHVPTWHDNARRAYVERFDVRTGEPAKPLEFHVAKLGNILSVEGRLLAANGEEVMCFTTVEKELARIDAALEASAGKAQLLCDRALVQLAAEPPDRAGARADFRRALDAPDLDGVLAATWRARALDNLFALAAEQNDLTAIAEARELVGGFAPTERMMPGPHPYAAQAAFLEVRVLGRLGRGAEALQALEGFLDDFGGTHVVLDERVVEAEVAARKVRQHLLASDAAFRAAFEESVRSRMQGAFDRGDAAELRAIPGRYAGLPPSGESFLLLAKLLESQGHLGEAEVALRNFIDRNPEHRRRGEAHLQLALFLARSGRAPEARAERDQGLTRLDEEARRESAPLLEELDRLLPAAAAPSTLARLRIPMQPSPLDLGGGVPVAVEGTLPEGLLVTARDGTYRAYDATGKVLWEEGAPGAGGAAPGPPGDPTTTAVACSVAGARLAFVVDGDLVLCDVAGMLRVDALTGAVRWRYPRHVEEAAGAARKAIERLRADLARTRAEGETPRRLSLPAYARSGNLVLRVLADHGVEAVDLTKGAATELLHAPIEGAPVGPPCVVGNMAAVGWGSPPGRVFVYDLAAGRRVNEVAVRENTFLAAPPVLDPLGRLYVVTSTAEGRLDQGLEILDARTGKRAHELVMRTESPLAAVLHADGRTLVFHDGGDGEKSLHFVDLGTGQRVSRRAPMLLRDVAVLRDGARFFVFTSTAGLEDTGARLFRVDLAGTDVLEYATPPRGDAYGPPLLTHSYLACIVSRPQGASVRLYDREASLGSGVPQPVFVLEGGRETADLDFPPQVEARYDLAPVLAARGEELFASHPFGVFRLAGMPR